MAGSFAAMQERRAFTRLDLDWPVEVRQGSKVWPLRLLDISLTGLGVSEPEDWDADYSHPFGFVLETRSGVQLELFANLVHIDPGHIGFELGHLDPEPLAVLAELLAEGLGADLIAQELQVLETLAG